MEINAKLKFLRKQKGINQDEAAQLLGVSLSSYQKYEREKNSVTPSLEVLVKLADFYGVTTDYLLGREPPNPFDALKLTKEQEADANAKYQMLTPQDKAIVASVIQAFAEAHRNEPKPTQMTAVKSVVLYDDSDSDEDSAQTA
ncbi:MAG: helix-turn-helix domain-containing protein [Oscillospiraceae bacterium]